MSFGGYSFGGFQEVSFGVAEAIEGNTAKGRGASHKKKQSSYY